MHLVVYLLQHVTVPSLHGLGIFEEYLSVLFWTVPQLLYFTKTDSRRDIKYDQQSNMINSLIPKEDIKNVVKLPPIYMFK